MATTTPAPELAARLYGVTRQGIDDLCALIERHKLPVDYRRDGTVTIYTDPARAAAAHALVEAENAAGIPTRFYDAATLRQQLNVEHGFGAIFDPGTGQINGAQLVRGLGPLLEAQGVTIYENTPVIKVREGTTITLTTPLGEVQAKAIVLATNGYTGKLGYFRDALFPLHSHVFATAPLSPAQRQALGWHGLAGFADDFDRISYASMTATGVSSLAAAATPPTATSSTTARSIRAARSTPMRRKSPWRRRWPTTFRRAAPCLSRIAGPARSASPLTAGRSWACVAKRATSTMPWAIAATA